MADDVHGEDRVSAAKIGRDGLAPGHPAAERGEALQGRDREGATPCRRTVRVAVHEGAQRAARLAAGDVEGPCCLDGDRGPVARRGHVGLFEGAEAIPGVEVVLRGIGARRGQTDRRETQTQNRHHQ